MTDEGRMTFILEKARHLELSITIKIDVFMNPRNLMYFCIVLFIALFSSYFVFDVELSTVKVFRFSSKTFFYVTVQSCTTPFWRQN